MKQLVFEADPNWRVVDRAAAAMNWLLNEVSGDNQ